MFRIAKPESYLLLSPTRDEVSCAPVQVKLANINQVARQNALEAYPLIQEPKSAFYKSPLAVLDFQSLYPSCMIAYNYWCVCNDSAAALAHILNTAILLVLGVLVLSRARTSLG